MNGFGLNVTRNGSIKMKIACINAYNSSSDGGTTYEWQSQCNLNEMFLFARTNNKKKMNK